MPTLKRHASKYPGVFWVQGTTPKGRPEKIFYIRYRINGKLIEEKAGRQFQDNMTAARANDIRSLRIRKKQLSNTEARKKKLATRWTLEKIWETYEATSNTRSIKDDEGRFRLHLKPVFGEKLPGEIAPLDVDRLRIKLLKKRSDQTVRHVIALLKRLINFGAKKRLCRPLAFTVTMPRVDNTKTEDLNPKQLHRLLLVLKKSSHVQVAAMMQLALFTGMRRGELLKLRWDDIDFDRDFIRIRDPKGGKSQSIPLNREARELLKNHPRHASKLVFPGRNGKKMIDIKRPLSDIAKKAKLPPGFRPFHGLRHVYASSLASSGKVDMYTLQRLLTHKDPRMTARYAHLRDEALRRAADLAGDLMTSRPKKAKKKSG